MEWDEPSRRGGEGVKTYYNFLIARNSEELNDAIYSINRDDDKIISVTQNGGLYTIFYEQYGNREEETT